MISKNSCLLSLYNASILSRYGSIFYIPAQIMVGTVRPATPFFLPTSRTRFADERGVSPCVCKWAEFVVLCHADKHSCLVKDRKSKRQVVLADWQITFAARQLAFLESFAHKPVRISVIGGALAVTADLQAVPFEDYLACENYYQGFLHTQSMECLAEMAHLLYPKLSDKACLEKAELLSVFYWFASVKANFTRMFPHLTSSLFCAIT